MKIKQISLKNFRCFRRAKIDLSADIVAIYGRNGVGKTTIFDAVEFALLGNIGRFLSEGEMPDYLPNVFSDGRLQIRVDFTGNTNGNDDAEGWIERTLGREPKAESLITSSGGWKNTNDLLYDFLVDELYLSPRREVKVIAELFRATALLSQDLIKDFIEGESEARARILSCISGSAYWHRCLDKAKDVMQEAKKRKKQEETEFKSIQTKAGELKQNIAGREARIKTIRERIGAEAGSYDFLLGKLKEAGISVEHMPPQTAEEEGPFLAAIRGICQERAVFANTRSKQLAELEAIVQQHPERLDRRRKLMEMIDKAKKDLGELLKKQEESNESLKEAGNKISELEGVILAQSNRFRALQELLELKLQKAGLIKMRDTGLTEIERIRRDLNEVKVGIEKQQAGLEGKRQGITGLQLSVTQISRTLDKLNIVKISIPTYKNLKEKISRLELQIQQLEEKREALDRQINEAQKQHINSNNKVAEMSKTVAAIKASSSEEEDLIVRFRRFAGDNECPLCGHLHATPDALQDAIAARLNNVSTAFQEAVEQLQNKTQELTKIKSEIASYKQELKETDDTLQKLRTEREEILTLASKIEEGAASAYTEAITARLLGHGSPSISPRLQGVANEGEKILTKAEADSGKALDSLINHSRETLLEHRNRLQQAEDWAKETEVRLRDGKVKAASLQEALDKQQKAYQEIQQKLISLDRRIIELGLTNESQLPKDRISQLIETARSLLVDQEEKKANKKIQIDKLQSELDAILGARGKVESSLKEWEQTLSRVISEIEDFCFKAKSFGLPGDASAEVIARARIHLSREKDRLDAAQRAVERYEATYKITLLEKERNEFYQQLEEVKRDEQGNWEKIKKIDEAGDEVQKWISSLTESVNQAVEAKINGHQMEIIRLFRAMIPSPYLFDKVSMRKSESGLELRLRYRGLKQDAGEPRFFLSSAQANILALSIFLSLAGRQQWSKLETILLDDPVQHLDDLDAVAFLDYLRAAALGNFCPRKQIIVSTCDQNLYLLMLRKFSLLESAGLRFMGISLLENSKKGAQIHYDVGGPEGISYVAEAV